MSTPDWQRVASFQIGIPDSKLTFAMRLARENGWSESYAERVILEYKRFMYLCATREASMTPSDQVDQAWHLHILYSDNYREFCETTLGSQVSHNPTAGGESERNKFVEWYEQTLNTYSATFNQRPPADIWPDSRIRFSKDVNAVRIHRSRYHAIPRWFFNVMWPAIILGIVTGLAFDWDFFLAWAVLSIPTMIFAGLSMLGRVNYPPNKLRKDGGCGCDAGCSGCGDGCGGCGD